MTEADWYRQLGVSAHKPFLAGLPSHKKEYFAAVWPDLAGDPAYCFALHADGVGTKGVLTYLWWRETGDSTLWHKLAQDALVMNTDDLACSGVLDGFVFSTTLTRNPFHIPDEVVRAIIEGVYAFAQRLSEWGFSVQVAGGETADMPDVVRTLGLEATIAARWPVSQLLPLRRPSREIVIIGLASYGQATYETEYNSGIGCNGLTAARHLLLHPAYAARFPESIAPENPHPYQGTYQFSDLIGGYPLGHLLTSPTRTYLPVLRVLYARYRAQLYAVIHCTGGGQRKALKYLPSMYIEKDHFLPLPPVFAALGEKRPWKDLFATFNMGHRLELYAEPAIVSEVLALAQAYGIEAQVIGRAAPKDGPTEMHVSFRGERWVWRAEP